MRDEDEGNGFRKWFTRFMDEVQAREILADELRAFHERDDKELWCDYCEGVFMMRPIGRIDLDHGMGINDCWVCRQCSKIRELC